MGLSEAYYLLEMSEIIHNSSSSCLFHCGEDDAEFYGAQSGETVGVGNVVIGTVIKDT